MHFGGITIPATIDNHGRYLYKKEILGKNGDAEAIESINGKILWTFSYMDMSDYTWIVNTLLLGQASRTFTSGQVKDKLGNLITITNAVVQAPTYEFASGGEVNSVVWEIERIRS